MNKNNYKNNYDQNVSTSVSLERNAATTNGKEKL